MIYLLTVSKKPGQAHLLVELHGEAEPHNGIGDSVQAIHVQPHQRLEQVFVLHGRRCFLKIEPEEGQGCASRSPSLAASRA